MDVTRQLKEDTPSGNQSQKGIPIPGAGIGHGGIGTPLLNGQAGASHPSLAPQSHPANKPLYERLQFTNKTPQIMEQSWQDDTPTLAEKQKKQVRFDVEGDLIDDPMLPQGLTLFLAESVAKE